MKIIVYFYKKIKMLDYKKLDKEIDVVLKSFTKEDLSLWLKLKLERENLEKDMKDFPLKNIIEEWLAKNGNPEIDKQVELEAKLLEEEFRRQKTKTVEEELLEQIKFALYCNNEAQAIRMLEQYKYYIQNKYENNN